VEPVKFECVRAEYWFEDVGQFRPHARYIPGISLVVVVREDCSYVAHRVNGWVEIYYKNYQSWFLRLIRWKKAVGFEVHYPRALGLKEVPGIISEAGSVRRILDRILRVDAEAFGKERRRLYKLARGLGVTINYKEE
jgi:hypothetical protein